MADLKLTLACGDYEITRPLTDGTVKAEGIEFVPDTRYGARDRHWAMAKDNAYDVCEFNAPAYIMARDRGFAWTALPVFAHRRFRHGFIFVNPNSGIKQPSDLIGKRVGGTNFQPAGNVYMRGVLEEEYGVPHDQIHWFTERGEDIDFEPHPGLRIDHIKEGQTLDAMLLSGELDARLEPEYPQPFLDGDPRCVQLFADPKPVEIEYYERTGIFPIMHVTVVKREVVDKDPWVVKSLMDAFEKAKSIAMKRVENPRVNPLAFWAHAWFEQKRLMGPDPWRYGLGPENRKTLEKLVKYTKMQGLISREWSVDELFEN
jgi:4,5-dihydroxyphthalate decarboxylase